MLLLAALAVTLLGLSRVRFEKRLSVLHSPKVALVAEDQRVRARAGDVAETATFVTFGPTLEEALRRVESVHDELRRAGLDETTLDDPTRLLWSESLRARNRRVVREDPKLVETTLEALEETGFERAAFAEFASAVATNSTLSSSELLGLFPERWLRPYIVRIPSGVALLTRLPAAAERRAAMTLEGFPHTLKLPREEALSELFASVARRTLVVLVAGFSLVVLVVYARYRNLRRTASALLGPVLSSGATLGLLAASGVELTLLHALALLLVLSMGEDYGIFLVDAFASESASAEKAALVSIALASLSTIVSFGLLALSDMPALRALGTTVALGDFLSLLFAPTSLLLLRRRAS